MSPKPHHQPDALRANVMCLVKECPFDQTNPGDCPLFCLRTLNRRTQSQWCNALDETDLTYLAAYHEICFKLKLHSQTPGRVAA